jgi:hypothetical protein
VHVVVRSKLAQWQTRILELLLLQLRHTTTAKQRVAFVGAGRESLLSALLEVELFTQSRQNHQPPEDKFLNHANASVGRCVFPTKVLGGSIADTIRQSAAMY